MKSQKLLEKFRTLGCRVKLIRYYAAQHDVSDVIITWQVNQRPTTTVKNIYSLYTYKSHLTETE